MATVYPRRSPATLRPKTEYSFPLLARGLADIIAEGGYGTIGRTGSSTAWVAPGSVDGGVGDPAR